MERIADTGSQSPCTCHRAPASVWTSRQNEHAGESSPARGTSSARRASQWGPARMPLRAQTSTSARPSGGGANQPPPGRASNRSKRIGAAAEWPVRPGRPSPSALPTHTPTAWRGVTPTAHASRKP